MTKSSSKTIVLGVSASIAAYRACDLVMKLRESGYQVRVVMSKDAVHFVTPLTFQSLSANKVAYDFFGADEFIKPIHIDMAQSADLFVIMPASADIIAKLSHGIADDVLSCSVLASTAPLVIVPAMNEVMYNNAFTQENIKRLKHNGAHFVDPIHGTMVCSGQGMGHVADNESILKKIQEIIG